MFNKFLLLCSFLFILGLSPETFAGDSPGSEDSPSQLPPIFSPSPSILPTIDDVEQSIKGWLGKIRDSRWKKALQTATYIIEESLHYDYDPYLTLSIMIRESSLRSRVQSTSSLREWGYAQAHGEALALCRRELKQRGIDYKSERGQVACVLVTLNKGVETCGVLVEDQDLCFTRRKHKNQQRKGCSGALSFYVSGSCKRANKSLGVSSAVLLRLKLAISLKPVNQ